MSELTGKTISHYKMLELVGQGGMGVVYKAHDNELDRIVALKFLPRYLTSDAMEKERFYHEARAVSSLNHPNVTTIYEIKEFEGQLFLAMEYVEGSTLKKLAEGEPLSVKKVLDIAIQVCDGLNAAHEKNIVHRDIKSDNIMIAPKGQVKIMDFGLAKVKGATKLTKAGSTIGTAAYMSPEQALGEEIDQRSDIFSFGVVLYELLTGKLPFRGEHQAALMYSLINEEPQPLARFNEKITPSLENAVAKALAKDRDERYQHVDDLLADLRRERKSLEYARAGYATTATMPRVEPPAKKTPPWRLIISGLAAAAAIVVLFVVNPFNLRLGNRVADAPASGKSLAVLYFENIPDPEDKGHTAEMLTNLLTTSLFQTREIEVISRERLYDIQKELGVPDTKTIAPSLATKVAERAGVSMMLLGSILQRDPALTVTYRLVEVGSGKIISTQRLSGFASDKIFALVDTLAFLVKNDLNVTSPSAPSAASVASVTSTSPEAYRSYLEGVQLNEKYFVSEAKAAFNRAIELDSNFAMAYFGLATLSIEPDVEMTRRALRKAWELSERVTEKERLTIGSTHAFLIEGNFRRGLSLLEETIKKYPREQNSYISLGTVYKVQGMIDKALEVAMKGLQNDEKDAALWNALAYTYGLAGRRGDAIAAVDRYLQLTPALPNAYDSKAEVYAMFGELDSVVYWSNKAMSFKSDFPSILKVGLIAAFRQDYATAEKLILQYAQNADSIGGLINRNMLAYIPIRRGRLQEAELLLRRNLEQLQAINQHSAVNDVFFFLYLLAYQRNDAATMLEYAHKMDPGKSMSLTQKAFAKSLLALAEVKNGHRDEYRRLTGELTSWMQDLPPRPRSVVEYTLGAGCYEEGKYGEAFEHFEKMAAQVAPNHVPPLQQAVTELKTGKIPAAIGHLERILTSSLTDDGHTLSYMPLLEDLSTASVKAYYWLGVAYEQQGEKAKALAAYGKFLEIWKDADFDSPELTAAKARTKKLKGEAS